MSATDVDECAKNNGKGDCEQTCTNTMGSFVCSCRPGYNVYSSDDNKCEGVYIILYWPQTEHSACCNMYVPVSTRIFSYLASLTGLRYSYAVEL